MNEIKEMLNKSTNIVRNHEKKEKITGERFNLFSILDRERKEVTTHSRFLAELLSPKGTHGQGSKFLEFFVRQLNKSNGYTIDFDCSTAEVIAELNIGTKEKNEKIGLPYSGQIDTFIKDRNNNCIVIENKIDAGDQEEQLVRYYEYLHYNSNYFKAKELYYLAPIEKAPDKKSIIKGEQILKKDEHFKCISYKDDIIPWLKECILYSANIQSISVTLNQYLRVVKKIAGQLNTEVMEEINQEVIRKNLIGAEAIAKSYDNTLEEISDELKKEVVKKLRVRFPHADIQCRKEKNGFSSIHINDLPLKDFERTIIIESFNTKGFHSGGALFIGKFINQKPKFYDDVKIILESEGEERLLENLSKYGRGEDREGVVNKIVVDIIKYIDERQV